MLSSWVEKKRISEIWIYFDFKTVCGCICMLPEFWPHCGACGLDITKWHRTPWRIIFWMLWRWKEHSQVTHFLSQPYTAIPWRGAHTKDWWEGLRGVCVCVCFHQPTEKEVIHKSVDTIQPRTCVLGARCHHVVSERQVRKRKTCLPVPTPPSAVSQLRIKDSGSMWPGGGEAERRRNAPGSDSSSANEILHFFFRKKHKSILILC